MWKRLNVPCVTCYTKVVSSNLITFMGHAQKGATMKYVCEVCGYTYDEAKGDPEHGIAPGTKWEELPDDFVCPLCGVGKDSFKAED